MHPEESNLKITQVLKSFL